MHGNSEMQKINQTSAMPEKTDVHWSGRFSVAPMLDWTDRHCRYFLRLLSRNTLLYTEMVTTGAIIHGKGDYLAYSEEEHPVALQLGVAIRRRWHSVRSWQKRADMMRST